MRNAKGSPKRWAKAGLMSGALALTVSAALVVGTPGPAAADPGTTYVGVGSDTTQDVMDQFAINVGGGAVGSWDAINPGTPGTAHDIISPKPGCSMTRPNGSGEGLSALRHSINTASGATPLLANFPEQGCVDFGRSSSGPGTVLANGALLYVPFALDAVAPATGSTTTIANADSFTKANLISLYTCHPVTVGGVTYDPNTPPAAGNTAIHLYIPQAGSGTRNFWAGQMTIDTANLPACVHDTFGSPALPVEEHDGSVFAADSSGLGPFSIAQFVAQTNGHNDRRHGAVIHSLDGIAPTVSGALNPAYTIKRNVYNIVKLSRVTTGSPDFDAGLTSLFIGSSSRLCSNSLTIRGFGFGLLTTAPLGFTCGQVSASLVAIDPNAI